MADQSLNLFAFPPCVVFLMLTCVPLGTLFLASVALFF